MTIKKHGGIFGRNPTFNNATISNKINANELDLTAIATSISDNAVDVFVYDTSKDSDGGAWRHRTQHTSWYNETLNTATRGSRREFPAVAVIVAESNQVTIYDGDDPDLPMWRNMGTGYGNISSIHMLNGILHISRTGGADRQYYMVSDRARSVSNSPTYNGWFTGNVVNIGSLISGDTNILVNTVTNDVAMTVLPNAPIDAATGLPSVTTAVATDGGVSVIKDDGTVVDITITQTKKGTNDISFIGNRIAFSAQQSSTDTSYWRYIVAPIPTGDISGAYWQSFASTSLTDYSYAYYASGEKPYLGTNAYNTADIYAADGLAVGGNTGLAVLSEDTQTPSKGMVNYITSSYNTGWMNGDIKLATLSDTTVESFVGSDVAPSSYTAINSYGVTFTSGVLSLSPDGHSDYGVNATITGLTEGDVYVLSYDVTTAVDGSHGLQTTDANGTVDVRDMGGVGSYSRTLVADNDGELFIMFGRGSIGGTSGSVTNVFENIVLRLAEEDRSVNGNGLQVFGTVTKSVVATGADLVAYSGFSGSNYLEQPYNSDLDLGTGDFCVMGWAKGSSIGNEYILSRTRKGDGTDPRFGVRGSTDNTIAFNINGTIYADTGVYVGDQWQQFVFVRRNGTVYSYINGEQKASAIVSGTLTLSDSSFFIGTWGTNVGSNSVAFGGYISLLRISATAPTAEQIAKIYEDEKFLFQENAKCTLYDTSDAVTALAYDDDTGLLHVGTSDGRSVFQGLRRVDNTTTAVGAAISASNGLVADE